MSRVTGKGSSYLDLANAFTVEGLANARVSEAKVEDARITDQPVTWKLGSKGIDYDKPLSPETERLTVRAAYPERFLSVLTHEVKWLVESFWKGLRCEVTVPCMAPCGKDAPGTGLFEVEKLIAFKKQEMQKFPCYVSGCSQAQDIDSLLRNAPAARRTAVEVFLADDFDEMRSRLDAVRDQLNQQDHQARGQFDILDQNDRRILSRIEDAYTGLMQSLTDEAKEGPTTVWVRACGS